MGAQYVDIRLYTEKAWEAKHSKLNVDNGRARSQGYYWPSSVYLGRVLQASCTLKYHDPQNNLKKHQNQTKLHLDDATVFLQSLYRLYSVNKVLEPATLQELFFFL